MRRGGEKDTNKLACENVSFKTFRKLGTPWAPGPMSALIVDTGQIMLIGIPNPGFNKLSMHNY